MFSNYVENGIYSMLATNVLTTASTVGANTIAIASVVIMQSMRESVNKPKTLNLMLLLKHIKKSRWQYSVSRDYDNCKNRNSQSSQYRTVSPCECSGSRIKLELLWNGLAQMMAELETITKTRTGKQGQLVNRLMLAASC